MTPIRPFAYALAAATGVGWAVTAHRLRRMTSALSRACRDQTTGLLTRAAWDDAVRGRLPEATVVGLLDLDGFKALNDAYGHNIADEVLHTIAQRLQAELGATGVAGRYGCGDELLFLARWPHSCEQVAALHSSLTHPVKVSAQSERLRIGVSLGLATLEGPNPDLANAVRTADRAMYRAKRTRTGWQYADVDRSCFRCPWPGCAAGGGSHRGYWCPVRLSRSSRSPTVLVEG